MLNGSQVILILFVNKTERGIYSVTIYRLISMGATIDYKVVNYVNK